MPEEETASVGEEAEEEQLPEDMEYDYEALHSRPSITPDSDIPENLLHLSHSFGYESGRRANLQLLDDTTLMFIAGNLLVLLDASTKEQRYLRSCSGGGIGCITVHPSKHYFVVAEKGNQPNIIIYEYPSLRLHRILRGGTERAYSFVEFNLDGSLLASVGNAPDFMLTLWNWRQEKVMLSCKAISQEVYRVSFSQFSPGLLTSSGSGHIKFWKMVSTFTGLKLQGLVGHFGKTPATDIESYVLLPDGKVVSGTDRGNLLLWDGNTIKAEIGRMDRQSCHSGTVQPFVLEEGLLLTFGSDGMIRGWDYETIDSADSSRFEMEPVNELEVGHNVCLSSLVRSPQPDSCVWFAQDSCGAIWKLDLSFTHTAPDPECLFSFHAGVIQGMDVSPKSHLMATIALDRSLRVFDFLSKRELTTSRFFQGGTALIWAPAVVNQGGGLLVTGFDDGVVRLLELFDPQGLEGVTRRHHKGGAGLHLKQAFKPHNATVTAVAFEQNGDVLATGSSDRTVFFFSVGEPYTPIGWVRVPGPVQGLVWSPQSDGKESRLLVLCQQGHVIEVHSSDLKGQKPTKSFELLELPRRCFRFRSIKSRIKREEEKARREEEKEKKKDLLKELKQRDTAKRKKEEDEEEEEEQEEEELPPIYIPDSPSPLYCGFHSQPGHFWLSMGGFDSGFLYHCKFSENQDEDPDRRQDEPFDFIPVHDADHDPIRSVTFSSNRQLLFCGMFSGSIRVYPLQPGDLSLSSMKAYWALSVHDNHTGHLRHICCSYDDNFVLTAGDDSNIFSFSLLPPEELQRSLQRQKAEVPSPRAGFEKQPYAQDIENSGTDSIATAKQKQEKERLQREAGLKLTDKRKKLLQLQRKFAQVLKVNQTLPEQVRLRPEELELHPCFKEEAERLKLQKMMEVRKQLSWEEERSHIALSKLQDWFRDSLESSVVTVVAIRSDLRVSAYRLPTPTEPSAQLGHQDTPSRSERDEHVTQRHKKSRAEPEKVFGEIEEEELLHPQVGPSTAIALGDRQEERLRKAVAKAEQARARKAKRTQEWAQLYAEKPGENYEDPQDVQNIKEARENMGDFKLKTGADFRVPRHLVVTSERKRAELKGLEENTRHKQTELNRRIVALRDAKVLLVSQLNTQAKQLHKVQQRLEPCLHRPPPVLPTLLPEEAPENRMPSRATLERYRKLRDQRFQGPEEEEESTRLLEQLEKEEENLEREKGTSIEEEEEEEGEEEVELSEMEEEIRLVHEQDCLLEEMEASVRRFDAELLQLRRQKQHLDKELALADLRQLTLYQELLVLTELEQEEGSLQEKFDARLTEENSMVSELEECQEQLKLKQRDIARLQERETALLAALQDSLGGDKKFETFLTRVFKKKIKRVKKKQRGQEEDEESDEDYNSSSDEGRLDDSVCPPDCEQHLFEFTLQLRERRLDLEEALVEERKCAEALQEECDALAEREKTVKNNLQEVSDELELFNREKQQKFNELDVVVPLRLHQIELVIDGSLPSDLSEVLVVDRPELARLQERIKQLRVEKTQQRDLKAQARQHHARLHQECKDMKARVQDLEKECSNLMMKKFGRLVDLEALQTLSGNRKLEALKQEMHGQEATHDREMKQWDARVSEAFQALMEVIRENTELLHGKKILLDERSEMEDRLNTRQKKSVFRQCQDERRRENLEDICQLQSVVKKQSSQADALRREIELLLRKGGAVLPPIHAQLPAPPPISPHDHIHAGKQGTPRLSRPHSSSRQGTF